MWESPRDFEWKQVGQGRTNLRLGSLTTKMSDNHFTYQHMTELQLRMLDADDGDDPCINEPLPDEGV